MYWNNKKNVGIGKIHCENAGVTAFLFDNGNPLVDVNFLDQTEISYYRQQCRNSGVILTAGFNIDTDTSLVLVQTTNDVVSYPSLNLEIKGKRLIRFFKTPNHADWQKINAPPVEYQPCKSLILIG